MFKPFFDGSAHPATHWQAFSRVLEQRWAEIRSLPGRFYASACGSKNTLHASTTGGNSIDVGFQ
jgi:hypothetical protein